MNLTIILLALLGLAGLILLVIVVRKLPQVRIIETDTVEGGKAKKLKNEIIRNRIERASTRRVEKVQRTIIQPYKTGIQNAIRRFTGKLVAIERNYQAKQKKEAAGGMTRELAKEIVMEAKGLIQEGNYDRAEKKLIEVISSHPRNTDAYEKLGRLYLKKKDYESAKETFAFLAKIVPKDASVKASLGEVEMGLGNSKKALGFFKKATQLSPNNSKYVDFLIESAIQCSDKSIALDGLKVFKALNPESKKIDQWKSQIKDINIIKK